MRETEEWKFFNIKVWIVLFLISFFLLIYREACSKVSGLCSDCHTMHYSQGGQPLSIEYPGGTNATNPFPALTKGDCVFCHSDKSGISKVPIVVSSSEPTYIFGTTDNVTAGGDFYWVATWGNSSDSKGHDVKGIASESYQEPPGWDSSYDSRRSDANWGSNQLTCSGKYGCHGNPSEVNPVKAILGAHHQNELCNSTTNNCDGKTVAKSYRFLLGILGTEDDDWELTFSTTDHNGYYAIDNPTGGTSNENSINYLCAECHGKFHSDTGNGSSPWLRHPTDYDMNNVSDKEYDNYPNPNIFTDYNKHDYFPEVPVGNEDGAVKNQVLQGTGNNDAIVLCISCHRAHATPFDDILRWDYKNWPGIPDDQNGCLACHTSKY